MRFQSLLLITPVSLVACWSGSAHAFDAFNLSTQGTVASGYGTSLVTCAPFDRKLLLAAHDHAAAFIASESPIACSTAGIRPDLSALYPAKTSCKRP